MKMNVDELVAAVKNCLNPCAAVCENCALQFEVHGCLDELFRRLDAFATAYKSQEAEIKKLNEIIIDLRLENEDLQEDVEWLADENDTLNRMMMEAK